LENFANVTLTLDRIIAIPVHKTIVQVKLYYQTNNLVNFATNTELVAKPKCVYLTIRKRDCDNFSFLTSTIYCEEIPATITGFRRVYIKNFYWE